jgi:hypothetical protein
MRALTRLSLAIFIPVALLSLLALSSCALRPLLSEVEVGPTVISPNADGQDDVTQIKYRIGQSADVSIYFTDAEGNRHYFRENERRSPGRYNVYWSGVTNDPQVRDVEGGKMLVSSQVLPDGVYTWTIEANAIGGGTQSAQGQITLQNADTALPEVHNFTVVPQEFTPNQDGIHDRVSISYYLLKDAERVNVYLQPISTTATTSGQAAVGERYPIAEDPTASIVETGKAGYHGYDYDGGVDLFAEPPPDGDYAIYADAEDRVGNHVVVSSTLTIKEGGKPRANVFGGEIDWGGEVNRNIGVVLGQTFCFTATVENDGPVPIRTSGPWPGQTYKFSENYNTLAIREEEESWLQQAGAWRFGVNFDSTGVDYPFRWAIGRKEDLEERIIDGEPQYYLLPGKRGQVSGCIEMDDVPPVGTQFWWGGLIHEFVEVANDSVDRISVNVGRP